MGLLEAIEKLINEHGSSVILRDHLNLVRQQAEALEQRVRELEQENAALKEQVAEFEEDTVHALIEGDYVECHGAHFKRKPTGGFHETVYCPSCHHPMSSLAKALPYQCDCGLIVDFTGRELKTVMSELPQ